MTLTMWQSCNNVNQGQYRLLDTEEAKFLLSHLALKNGWGDACRDMLNP